MAIKPLGQQGHQRLSWTWSDQNRINFDQNPRLVLLDLVRRQAGPPQASNNNWTIMYDFDQYLYTEEGTKDQGFGLFGMFGVSPGVVNPIEQFYSTGLGGKGAIPGRDDDTYGLGYYFLALTEELGGPARRLVGDEQGVELYYNIAITPWLHLTPDLQIIDPGRHRFSDTAVVAGLRMKIDF